MRAPKTVTALQEKFTEEHKALKAACISAVGREAYEAARLAYNSKLTEDFGAEANPILQVGYDKLIYKP